jgi:hypothetical protein
MQQDISENNRHDSVKNDGSPDNLVEEESDNSVCGATAGSGVQSARLASD